MFPAVVQLWSRAAGTGPVKDSAVTSNIPHLERTFCRIAALFAPLCRGRQRPYRLTAPVRPSPRPSQRPPTARCVLRDHRDERDRAVAVRRRAQQPARGLRLASGGTGSTRAPRARYWGVPSGSLPDVVPASRSIRSPGRRRAATASSDRRTGTTTVPARGGGGDAVVGHERGVQRCARGQPDDRRAAQQAAHGVQRAGGAMSAATERTTTSSRVQLGACRDGPCGDRHVDRRRGRRAQEVHGHRGRETEQGGRQREAPAPQDPPGTPERGRTGAGGEPRRATGSVIESRSPMPATLCSRRGRAAPPSGILCTRSGKHCLWSRSRR